MTVFIIYALGRLIFGRTGLLGRPEGRKRVAPNSKTLLFNLTTGFTLGFLNGYVALATGQAVLGFRIALAALVFLQAGAEDCPILHNVALAYSRNDGFGDAESVPCRSSWHGDYRC